MTGKTQVPACIQLAYDRLKREREANISEELHAVEDDTGILFRFEYVESVAVPNPEGVPSTVPLRVDLPETFPFDPPKIYSKSAVLGFPHQDAETGKLCLLDESMAVLDEGRLLQYVEWTKLWLDDAAQGRLLQEGDPYELPDFSRRSMHKALGSKPTVYTLEAEGSLDCWKDRIGQTGSVSFRSIKEFSGVFPSVFRDESRAIIAESTLAKPVIDPAGPQLDGRWVLLDSLCYIRHRPPQNYGELAELCIRSKINLNELLSAAWRATRKDIAPCIILFGFPIPSIVGKPPVRVHWQPLFFDGIDRQFQKHKQKHGRIRTEGLFNRCKSDGEFADHKPILWGRSVNISEDSLYARGPLSRQLRDSKLSLCGCGALGSMIAEVLARGGVKKLCLFDEDDFELGNQCRHTLDGRDIDQSKARSLARRLQSCNPLSEIAGYRVHLPISDASVSAKSEPSVALLGSDVIIDSALSEGGFQWLSRRAHDLGIRLVAIFFNLRATMLTVCVSGKRAPCYEVLSRLYDLIRRNKTPVTLDEYDPPMTQADKVLPETGCWHATFPAINNHIWMLASVGIETMIPVVLESAADDGYAAILRRHEFVPGDEKRRNMVEVLWEARL